jgi:hypothetical protein
MRRRQCFGEFFWIGKPLLQLVEWLGIRIPITPGKRGLPWKSSLNPGQSSLGGDRKLSTFTFMHLSLFYFHGQLNYFKLYFRSIDLFAL